METPFNTLADPSIVAATEIALLEHGFLAEKVASGAEALERVKALIPVGASINNGASITLKQIGYIDYLKEGKHGWNNLKEAVAAETDPEKQARMRRESVISDVYVGSVSALSATGEMLVASNTGSQLSHLAFTSPVVILVVSTQKIVPNLTDAFERLEKHVMPLEDENIMNMYKIHTTHAKSLILHRENPMMGRKVHVILVNERLGF